MNFFLLGFSHKTAPVEVREKLDFSKLEADEYLPDLQRASQAGSCAIVSTCNRVEIYATAKDGAGDLPERLRGWLASRFGAQGSVAGFYQKEGRDALTHLFRVASSLDSMVVGEPQILGQVKDAYQEARRLGLSSPLFDRIFQKTFFVAKKARSETKIGEQAVSISYLAVELAKKIHGDLSKTSVLILGAGEMAELCARHLRTSRVGALHFSNRTYENSLVLAKEYQGVPIPFAEFAQKLAAMDIVIVSTGATDYLLGYEDLRRALDERRQNPMFVIDISVPRNVDPKADALENVYLYNIDDLQQLIETNLTQRKEAAAQAEALVLEEASKFFSMLDRLKLAPLIQVLQEKYDAILEKELSRVAKKFPDGASEDLSKAKDAILKKILHHPIAYAHRRLSEADLDETDRFLEILGLKGEVDDG